MAEQSISETTTNPRHPVHQGVNAMRGIFGVGITEHQCLRIPLDVCEDVLGKPYSGSFADDQVIRTTLAVDPACPAWIRDSRHSLHDQTALVLLGPTLEQRQQSPASQEQKPDTSSAPAAPKRAPEVLTAADELYDVEMALALAFFALSRSPSEGVCLSPSENAGLIGLIDRARWIVRDQRHAIVGEPDEG